MSTLIDSEITARCVKGNPKRANSTPPMIYPFYDHKHEGPPSWGLSSVGYDVRVGEQWAIYVDREKAIRPDTVEEKDITRKGGNSVILYPGNFILAETMEHFHMPEDVYATVHDKSSWIRLGLSVHNTVIEPGWVGVLTLEIKNNNPCIWIEVKFGDGIAQVMFHQLGRKPKKGYQGQYQNQRGLSIPGGFEVAR